MTVEMHGNVYRRSDINSDVVKRLNIRQIEAFQAVMMLGNMTRAAEYLDISQPAVSRLIADLQAVLGFPLFTRRRHGAVPTVDAERLNEEVESLFFGLDELSRRANAIRDLQNGELRVAAISLYGNGLLPRLISKFMAAHPGIKVSLELSQHEKIIDWMIGNRCDIGMVSLPANNGDLTVFGLAARPALCVMPADHPLISKPVIDASDLADQPFVSFPRNTSTRYQIDRVFNLQGVRRKMNVVAGNHEAVCSFVAAGMGVSIISPFYEHQIRTDARIVSRPFTPSLIREIGLLVDDDRLSLAGAAFRDHVINHFHNVSTAVS